MSHEFRARLRAARIVRPLTSWERYGPIAAWIAVALAISIAVLVWGADEYRWIAIAPATLGAFAVIQGLKRKETKEFSKEGLAQASATRQLDREKLGTDVRSFLKGWLGRLLVSGAIVGSCYLYAKQGQITKDEGFFLLLLCIGAAIWAWQTSLALLACGVLWWLTTLDWHLSTPTAVIVGALIIAAAIRSKH